MCRTGAILTCPKLIEAIEVVRGRQNALVMEAERKERLSTVKQVKLKRLSDGLDGRHEGWRDLQSMECCCGCLERLLSIHSQESSRFGVGRNEFVCK